MWPFKRQDERVALKRQEQRRNDVEYHGSRPGVIRSLSSAFEKNFSDLVGGFKTTGQNTGRSTRLSARVLQRYGSVFVAVIFMIIFFNRLSQSRSNHDESQSFNRVKRGYQGKDAGRVHHWPGWQGIRNVYAFGDSHTDTGFTLDGLQPDKGNPIGNPQFPGQTGNFGHNYLSHLTGTFNESFIKTYNLATSGSVVVERKVFSMLKKEQFPRLSHWTLSNQVDYAFLSRYGKTASAPAKGKTQAWNSAETLFVLYPGNNEILEEYLKRHGPRNLTETELYLDEIEKNMNHLYEYGARNFLVINNPCLEEAPAIHVSGIIDGEGRLGAELVDINGRLAFTAHHFAEAHVDATVFFFDNYSLAMRVRGHPSDYEETNQVQKMEGFCFPYAEKRDDLNTDDPLCGVPLNRWFWRDDEHITEPYHRLLARMIVKEISDIENALPFEFY